jgi:hypothetical protein
VRAVAEISNQLVVDDQVRCQHKEIIGVVSPLP